MELDRRQLGRQIAGHLRRDILFGRLQAGQILTQADACDRFGTSRMPVRDAFRQLVHEGFLSASSSGRVQVSALTATDIADMFRVEAALHGLAARRATQRLEPGELEILTAIQARIVSAAGRSDWAVASEGNRAFHAQVNRMSKSPKLIAALRAVSVRVHAEFFTEIPGSMDNAMADHETLIRALASGDAGSANSVMTAHVLAAGAWIIKRLLPDLPATDLDAWFRPAGQDDMPDLMSLADP